MSRFHERTQALNRHCRPAPQPRTVFDHTDASDDAEQLAKFPLPIAAATRSALYLNDWVGHLASPVHWGGDLNPEAPEDDVESAQSLTLMLHVWWRVVARLSTARTEVRLVSGYLNGCRPNKAATVAQPSPHHTVLELATRHTAGLLKRLGYTQPGEAEFDPGEAYHRPAEADGGTGLNQNIQNFLMAREQVVRSLYCEEPLWEPRPSESLRLDVLKAARDASKKYEELHPAGDTYHTVVPERGSGGKPFVYVYGTPITVTDHTYALLKALADGRPNGVTKGTLERTYKSPVSRLKALYGMKKTSVWREVIYFPGEKKPVEEEGGYRLL